MTTEADATGAVERAGQRDPRRLNWPLLLIAGYLAPVGLQATLLPRSFFEDFPLGRGWVAATEGAYNEHLVRDVGVLFVSLVLAAAWTAKTRLGDRAVATAWIVQGLAHVAFHAAHLDQLGGADGAALVGSLAVVPMLGVFALRFPATRPPG